LDSIEESRSQFQLEKCNSYWRGLPKHKNKLNWTVWWGDGLEKGNYRERRD
jgi:hypothetical protein